MLRGGSYTEADGRLLFGAASQLAALAQFLFAEPVFG
jgi:hypothetical protein